MIGYYFRLFLNYYFFKIILNKYVYNLKKNCKNSFNLNFLFKTKK